MIRRLFLVLALASVFTGMLAFAPTGVASAAAVQQKAVTRLTTPAIAEMCKDYSTGLSLYAANYWEPDYYYCSGTYYFNTLPFVIHANQWSGYVYMNNGGGPFWEGYCDGDTIYGNQLLTLYLSPVRETWCS